MDQSLQRMRVRYLAPGLRRLGAFWSWWTGELLAMLPPTLQSVLSRSYQQILIDAQDDALILRRSSTNSSVQLTRIPLPVDDRSAIELPDNGEESVVLLPADKVLVRSMSLPLAAEENLREVLSFEMDRQTPFTVDQVYYDYVVTGRVSAAKKLFLDLVVAPRRIVDTLVDNLASAGLRVDTLTTRGSCGTSVLPVNLLPQSGRNNRNHTRRRVNAALATVAVLLGVLAVTLPVMQKKLVLEELERQLVDTTAQAESAIKLRRQVEGLAAGSDYLLRKKGSGMSVLTTMNDVTRVVPDHTWISRLDISATEIHLQGQSSAAATLVSLLEGVPTLTNVRFRSPLVRIPATGEERFHLSADFELEQTR